MHNNLINMIKIAKNEYYGKLSRKSFFILFIFFSFNFASFASAQSNEEMNSNLQPEVETQIENPDGSLRDASFEVDSNIQDKNITVDPDFVPMNDDIKQEGSDIEKIDLNSKFNSEIFTSISLSIKNFSSQFHQNLKENPLTLDEIDSLMLDLEKDQKNIDNNVLNLRKRSSTWTFIVGPDYKSIKEIETITSDIKDKSLKIDALADRIQNKQFSDMLRVFDLQLRARNSETLSDILEFKNKGSIFGWFFRKFI